MTTGEPCQRTTVSGLRLFKAPSCVVGGFGSEREDIGLSHCRPGRNRSVHPACRAKVYFDITPHVPFADTMSDIGCTVWFFDMGVPKLPRRKRAVVRISRGAEIDCRGAALRVLRPHRCARRET